MSLLPYHTTAQLAAKRERKKENLPEVESALILKFILHERISDRENKSIKKLTDRVSDKQADR